VQERRGFSPWPIVGVLSVLIPALIFAFLGYRAETQRQTAAGRQLEWGSPEEVATAFLGALSDGRSDLAGKAVAEGAKVDVGDPGYRGLREVRVTTDDPAGDADNSTAVLVEFVTVRPWASGEPPGPQKMRLVLARQDERWMVVRIAPD